MTHLFLVSFFVDSLVKRGSDHEKSLCCYEAEILKRVLRQYGLSRVWDQTDKDWVNKEVSDMFLDGTYCGLALKIRLEAIESRLSEAERLRLEKGGEEVISSLRQYAEGQRKLTGERIDSILRRGTFLKVLFAICAFAQTKSQPISTERRPAFTLIRCGGQAARPKSFMEKRKQLHLVSSA